jgi:outer membrane receptor protein involved in Fe transport
MNSAVCDTYIHINNIKDIDDKFMIDLIFVYQLIDNLNLSVKIENIANDIYQEHDLAPGRSRTVLGGFEVKF